MIKPRLMALVLFTMSIGILLAPGEVSSAKAVLSIIATAGVVGACSCLNMYMERNLDGLMLRTRNRPIPSGRLKPEVVLAIGLLYLMISIPTLFAVTNRVTALLGAIAAFNYICIYTPLKTRSHMTLYIGAISGAIPVLMGNTVVTGSINTMGLSLFGILYAWQLYHFISIALRYENDYRRAGIKVYPVVKGRDRTRNQMVIFCLLLWVATLTPLWVTKAGGIYFLVASAIGFGLSVTSLISARETFRLNIDRKMFLGSLGALPVLLSLLVADANHLKSYWPW
jgi:protoheme IX farnesyltransferase